MLEQVNRPERCFELLIDQHHVHNHRRARRGDNEMNDAQSEADSQGDGTNYRTPDEVALMHLSQQREHQQPRSGDRNQDARVAIANLLRSPVRAYRECAKVEQPQRPLQREMEM